jgi:Ca-activated chloride channel family protein
MLSLDYPFLLLLLPLPWLVARLVPAHRESRPAVQVPFLSLMARLTGRQPGPGAIEPRRSLAGSLFLILVWLLLVMALARPQWLEDPQRKEIPMRDMLLAVDLSGSMETQDFAGGDGQPVDRLTAVKEVLDGFLARRDGDRIGLMVFGSAPFVQAPFTDDLAVLRTLLSEVALRMAGPKTVIGDAIGLAITLFERSEVEDRVLILLTDGNDTNSLVPPDRAAQIARDNGIVIHTIGVGDPAAAGEEPLNETSLEAIATTTGGRYFRALDRAALEEIYDELDRLTPRQVETLTHQPRRELFQWPLAAALCLSLFYQLLSVVAVMLAERRRADDRKAVAETRA